MTNTTASEVQFEHKQWLHDIDRWSFYLQSWRSQAQELVREYRRLQKMVEQYAEDLDDFGDEMGAHSNRLLANERALIEHRRPAALDEKFVQSHEVNTAKHAELYKMHERLQQMQQTLTRGLAVLHRDALRGE